MAELRALGPMPTRSIAALGAAGLRNEQCVALRVHAMKFCRYRMRRNRNGIERLGGFAPDRCCGSLGTGCV